MLDDCYASCRELRLKFNAAKSYCIAFGMTAVGFTQPMLLGSDTLAWSQFIKYMGVHVLAVKSITFDVSPAKRACNSILSHSNNTDELVQLKLQELYCLPILTYSIAAVDLKAKQLTELNVCWNSVYMRLFGLHKWESVRACINKLGRLDLLKVRKSNNRIIQSAFCAFSRTAPIKDKCCYI